MIDLSKFRGPLVWSTISLFVLCVYGILGVTRSLSPLFHQSIDSQTDSQTSTLLAKHDDFLELDVARFQGRSAFFKPLRKAPPPPPPPKRVDPIVDEPEPDPGPPPAPLTYMGPDLIAIIGDEAWFRGTGSGGEAVIRLQSGEELDGLKVLSTSLPSMVTVEYRRGVYELDLFSIDQSFFLEQPPPTQEFHFLKEVGDRVESQTTS